MSELAEGRAADAWIAEHVMAWRWFDIVGRAVLIPPWRLEEMRASHVLYTELPNGPGDRERNGIDGEYFYDSLRYPNGMFHKIPNYTTDLGAAMEVFLEAASQYDPPMASILWARDRWVVMCGRGQAWQGYATGKASSPLAICRAAYNEYADRIECHIEVKPA